VLESSKTGIRVGGKERGFVAHAYGAILKACMRHRGRVVSQHELTEQVYGQDWDKESNAMEVLIGRLRKKIGADVIETRRGFGYLIAEEAAP
jgi:DNA-binding response OmpR family regulator